MTHRHTLTHTTEPVTWCRRWQSEWVQTETNSMWQDSCFITEIISGLITFNILNSQVSMKSLCSCRFLSLSEPEANVKLLYESTCFTRGLWGQNRCHSLVLFVDLLVLQMGQNQINEHNKKGLCDLIKLHQFGKKNTKLYIFKKLIIKAFFNLSEVSLN